MAFIASRLASAKFVPIGGDFINLDKVRYIRPVNNTQLRIEYKPIPATNFRGWCDDIIEYNFESSNDREKWLQTHTLKK